MFSLVTQNMSTLCVREIPTDQTWLSPPPGSLPWFLDGAKHPSFPSQVFCVSLYHSTTHIHCIALLISTALVGSQSIPHIIPSFLGAGNASLGHILLLVHRALCQLFKKCTRELWAKFYFRQNEGYSLGDSTSDSSEKLLQTSGEGRTVYIQFR